MIKMLLQMALPLAAPTLFYMAWRTYARYAAAKNGTEPKAFWEKTPYFALTVCGFVLMAGTLAAIAMFAGAEPGSTYHSPVLMPDGTIRPGYHD